MTQEQISKYEILKTKKNSLDEKLYKFKQIEDAVNYDTWGYKWFSINAVTTDSDDGKQCDNKKEYKVSLDEEEAKEIVKIYKERITKQIEEIEKEIEGL